MTREEVQGGSSGSRGAQAISSVVIVVAVNLPRFFIIINRT